MGPLSGARLRAGDSRGGRPVRKGIRIIEALLRVDKVAEAAERWGRKRAVGFAEVEPVVWLSTTEWWVVYGKERRRMRWVVDSSIR